MFRFGVGSQVALVTIIAIVAFVVCLLAFFFTAPTRVQYAMNGEPHAQNPFVYREFISRTDTTRRPDQPTARTPLQPPNVGESRPSEDRGF
jgi:hypothetical protein